MKYLKPYIDTHIVDTYGTVVGIINPKAKIKFNSKFQDGTPRKLLDIKNLNYLGWSHKTKLKKGIELTYIWAKNKKEI